MHVLEWRGASEWRVGAKAAVRAAGKRSAATGALNISANAGMRYRSIAMICCCETRGDWDVATRA
eukprot:scaffold30431_cov63-Phaeocystis_antarctica.AAC.2